MEISVKEFLWGEKTIFEVATVEEAVELAHELKANGRYDWFRGQVEDSPPYSSAYRRLRDRGDAANKETSRRMWLFVEWVMKTSDLHYLLKQEHVHDLFAIMQHYGIPTDYIDFTTDPAVAGFFAADTKSPPNEGRSCIYCLNTEDLKSTWDLIKEQGARQQQGATIELVKINVRNLWRLQAQQGVFVYANYNWDVDYPLDRITFPYTGYPAYPTRERVYPDHKSPLEQLLDQYFSIEDATFANEKMRRLIAEIQSRGGHAIYTTCETWAEGYYPEAFPDKSRMVALDSWSPEALRGWGADLEEDYYEAAGPTLRLRLRPTIDPGELREQISFAVKQILHSEPNVRSKAVNWDFAGLAEQISSERLNSFFRQAWNGMRRLPYSEAEIANALGSILALLVHGFGGQTPDAEADRQRFSQCFGDSIKVEFGYHDGSGSRGYVSRESLANAMRPDMMDLLSSNYQKNAGNVKKLFKIINNPSLMFEFEPFKIVFAGEIIPSQVVLGRSLILFNPARLKTFGNP